MSFLKSNAPKIIADIKLNSALLRHFNLLFQAYQGNIEPIFEEVLLKAIKDDNLRDNYRTFKALHNYYKYAVEKRSQVYNFDIDRLFSVNPDEMVEIIKTVNFKKVMHGANELCNNTNSGLLQAGHDKNYNQTLRSHPNDRFWVWTDDPLDNLSPKVYILMICELPVPASFKDKHQTNYLYHMWTDTEFLSYEKVGQISPGTEHMINPYGFAPFLYINYNNYGLIPAVDTSSSSMAVGPAFGYTAINVAIHHQGNPLVVMKNVDKKNSKLYTGFDGAIMLNGNEDSKFQPEIQIIPSALDISQALSAIDANINSYLKTHKLPALKEGAVSKSGVAMMLDSVDMIEDRMSQIHHFKIADEQALVLLARYKNWLINNKLPLLPKRASKIKIDVDNLTIDSSFELPSTEAKQKEKAMGEDVTTGEDTNEQSTTESTGEDTTGA